SSRPLSPRRCDCSASKTQRCDRIAIIASLTRFSCGPQSPSPSIAQHHRHDAVFPTRFAACAKSRIGRLRMSDGDPYQSHDRSIPPSIHPMVWKILIGSAVWVVVSAWGFIAATGYVGLALAVVSAFVLMSILLPVQLWRIA